MRAALWLWLAGALALGPACSEDQQVELTYTVPLQRGAYWPKFRRTANNRGHTPLRPGEGQSDIWSFATGKGIFSSPVIDRDGTIYIGSADKYFYAIGSDGTLRWKKKLGELVDSAALIGEDGTIHVGSGDGFLYAFDPTGKEKWKFRPKGGAFITWFEGNVTMGPGGKLYAGNDDFHLYAVDPASGKERWSFKTGDQIWSAAAFSVDGTLYFGSNDLKLRALDPTAAAAGAEKPLRWQTATLGSVVSSPLVSQSGIVMFGSFDSNGYAHDARTGEQLWFLPTRDHIYASAAEAPDGTLYLPSSDGTLYAFTAEGKVLWTFDTLEPIRSSPAVDGDGTVYFGSGDGKLYAINPDGTRRWSFDTSVDDRNDLNSSPALGRDAIYIAGEDGKVWSVPYDYCLRKSDARCNTSPGEDLPDEGGHLLLLTHGGSSVEGPAASPRSAPEGREDRDPPATLGVGEALAFRLVVREKGDTVDAALDPDSLKLTVTPDLQHQVAVSSDGSFLVLVPDDPLAHASSYKVRVQADYLVDGERFGNMVMGGRVGGKVDRTFDLRTADKGSALPLSVTADRVPVLDLHRLAAPLPAMLPSYNQIGFDFMHLLVGVLELDAGSGRALAWVAAARTEGDGVVIDTTSEQRILFPLVGKISGDSMVLQTASFRVEFAGVDVPIKEMRIGATLDSEAKDVGGLSVFGRTICKDVEFYGSLLRIAGLCNPKTDELVILGTALFARSDFGGERPSGLTVGTPQLVEAPAGGEGSVTVKLSGSLPSREHLISLLLLDAAGQPFPVNYSQNTTNTRDASGRVTEARLTFKADHNIVSGAVEVVVIHDLFPVARFKL